ncbi:MAG: gamma-glutamyl-gamma-aminobutyrate hydrolase family protein [SAR202 cluster bacterium]|nr:gamma-glutamyl-gamma-aminobutyrate hydrolase family protein [SAR202 cluster bacterium]
MPAIGIVASSESEANRYVEAMVKRGVEKNVLLPLPASRVADTIAAVDGLLLSGGPDINPDKYGEQIDPDAELQLNLQLDEWEFPLLRSALALDMPVLGICRGMQLINVCFGGSLIQNIVGHDLDDEDRKSSKSYHQVYISPGSKIAGILGSGGFVRVNSLHHQGLKEPQKAKSLMASVYSLADGIIEALESPHHDCVIGVQWHNECERELPKSFGRLFDGLIERSRVFSQKRG